jgi:hypothetical protein
MGLGYNDNDGPRNDFWEWDQGSDQWIKMAGFEGDARIEAVSVSIGNKGYIV